MQYKAKFRSNNH